MAKEPSDPIELCLRFCDGANANEVRRLIELKLLDSGLTGTAEGVREAMASARAKLNATMGAKQGAT